MLVLVLLFERKEVIAIYSKKNLKEKDFSQDALLSSSIMNLEKMNKEVEIKLAHPSGSNVIWINANDNFIAIRMLLPDVKNFIEKEIGKNFLFTIPSRDIILIWNIDAPKELTEKHRKEAKEDFESEEYSLSPNVFIFNGNRQCKKFP